MVEKEPYCRQYWVTAFVVDDSDVNPQATVTSARDCVWQKYGHSEDRFRVTRAEARGRVIWSDADGEELEVDQLVFVCDYVAKGANAHDARKKIHNVLDETGISVLDVTATEIAKLRVASPTAVPEDLPSHNELLRRAEL